MAGAADCQGRGAPFFVDPGAESLFPYSAGVVEKTGFPTHAGRASRTVMGIHDRDYYRREGPSFLASIADVGRVCKYLILANVLFFVLQVITPAKEIEVRDPHGQDSFVFKVRGQSVFTEAFDLKPSAVMHGEVWRLLTYAFLHDQSYLWHIFFNMLFLWWFGSEVETTYGGREFLWFYLVSAVLGGVAFTAWSLLKGQDIPCLGASGAVTATMVLYACHFPTRKILISFLIPVPIWLFVGFQVAQDLYHFMGQVETTTAVTVHLAGALFGFVYYKMQWRVSTLLPTIRLWEKRQRARSRFRVYREPDPARAPVAVAAPAAPSADVDEQLEAKLDAVLQKFSQHGKDSLTEGERQILVQASEIFRKRRS
jgi:membrane associated rhomboid family serine protease